MTDRILLWTERLNRAVLCSAVLLLTLAVAVIVANVVTRYVGRASLPWSSEMARYLVVWSALLASAVLTARDDHLVVDALRGRLGEVGERWVRGFGALVSATFSFVLLCSGALLVLHTAGQVTSSIAWLPIAAVYAVVPIAALLMVWGTLAAVLRAGRDGERAAE
jgi:TRAP-type C4-dicarboxylate transport system permease small subunit